MTTKQPLNLGRTHDGKDFHMFAKGTHKKERNGKAESRRGSGRSSTTAIPDGVRHGEYKTRSIREKKHFNMEPRLHSAFADEAKRMRVKMHRVRNGFQTVIT